MRRNIRGRRDRAAKSRIKITRVAFVSFRVNWYCTKRWARDEASGRSAQNTEQGKNTFLSFRSSSKRSNVARYKGSFPRLCIFSFLSGRKNNTIDRGVGGEEGFVRRWCKKSLRPSFRSRCSDFRNVDVVAVDDDEEKAGEDESSVGVRKVYGWNCRACRSGGRLTSLSLSLSLSIHPSFLLEIGANALSVRDSLG